MDLTGFSDIDLCAPGLPGISILEYIPVDEVSASDYEWAVNAAYNQQRAILSDSTWLKMPIVAGSGSWNQDPQSSDQGQYFNIAINGLLPSDSNEIRGEIDRMKQHRYLVRLTRGGKVVLAGTPEQPLRFEARYESGAQGSDTRGHRVSFTGESLHSTPGYIPVF